MLLHIICTQKQQQQQISKKCEHSAVAKQPWTLGANKRYVGVKYDFQFISTYVGLDHVPEPVD